MWYGYSGSWFIRLSIHCDGINLMAENKQFKLIEFKVKFKSRYHRLVVCTSFV